MTVADCTAARRIRFSSGARLRSLCEKSCNARVNRTKEVWQNMDVLWALLTNGYGCALSISGWQGMDICFRLQCALDQHSDTCGWRGRGGQLWASHQPIHPHETTGMIVADCTAARRVHFSSGARPMQGLIEQSRSGKIWMRSGHFWQMDMDVLWASLTDKGWISVLDCNAHWINIVILVPFPNLHCSVDPIRLMVVWLLNRR